MNEENKRLLREMDRQQDRSEKISAIFYVSASVLFVIALAVFYIVFGY